jgi:hypothetical protein
LKPFDEFLEAVREKAASGERFIRFDLKPPFPDTPTNWEDRVESAIQWIYKEIKCGKKIQRKSQ